MGQRLGEKIEGRYVGADALVDFTRALLAAEGADRQQATVFAKALVWSDLIGRTGHGVWRLPAYLKRFKNGLIKCPCVPRFEFGGVSIGVLDGDEGFGHYVGHVAMQQAIELASATGIGLISVHNSNHFGTGAYFVDMAARQNMLGIATSNSIAKLAPHGGVTPVFGTNPLAIGAPRSNGNPIILDMATAAVSGAEIIRAADNKDQLQEGILVDRLGNYITDPSNASEGAMLPFGGAKGSGLAFFVEVLSAVVSGAALSRDVRSMFNDFSGSGGNGHCFIAIDLSKLLSIENYHARLDQLILSVRDSGMEEVQLPGDGRWNSMQKNNVKGIFLDDQNFANLNSLAEEYSLSILP